MSTLESFLATPQFEKMMDTCIGWAIAFLVVLLITVISGLHHDIPVQVLRRIDAIKKSGASLMAKFDKPEAVQPKAIVPAIRSLYRRLKKVDRLLVVHLYDNSSCLEAVSARGVVGKMEACCKASILAISTDKSEMVKSQMVILTKEAESVETLLNTVVERERQEKLLKI